MSDAGLWKIINDARSNSQLSQKLCFALLICTEKSPSKEEKAKADAVISGFEKLASGQGVSSFNFMLLMTVTGEGTRCKQMLNILSSRRDTVSGHGQPPM